MAAGFSFKKIDRGKSAAIHKFPLRVFVYLWIGRKMKHMQCLITVVAFSLSSSADAQLLVNPGLEQGPVRTHWTAGDPWDETVEPDGWIRLADPVNDTIFGPISGSAAWKQTGFAGTAPAQEGQRFVSLTAAGNQQWAGYYQQVNGLSPGDEITFGVWYKPESPDPSAAPTAFLLIHWIDGSGKWMGCNYTGLQEDAALNQNWRYYELQAIAPAQAESALFMVTAEGHSRLCMFDNLTAFYTHGARNPWPARQDYVFPSGSVTLTWQKPDGVLVDLYFGTDQNLTSADLKISAQDQTEYNPGTLVEGTTYYWRVDTPAQTGQTWSFTYGNRPPRVSVNDNPDTYFISYSPALKLGAWAEDLDQYPAEITCQWQITSGPSTASFNDPSRLNAELNFLEAGTYEVSLTVSDGDAQAVSSKTIEVKASELDYLRLYMPFDTATGTTDLVTGKVGTLRTPSGTYTGRIPHVEGVTYECIDPTGGTDDLFVQFLNDPDFLENLGDQFTISMWVKSLEYTAEWLLFTKGRNLLLKEFTDEVGLDIFIEGSRKLIRYTGTVISPGDAWHHVAVSYRQGRVTLFVNGAAIGSAEASGSFDCSRYPYPDYVIDASIGSGSDPSHTSRSWKGLIDEVKVHNIGLTENDIRYFARNPSAASKICTEYSQGDVNRDCYVDMNDFLWLAQTWSQCTDLNGPCGQEAAAAPAARGMTAVTLPFDEHLVMHLPFDTGTGMQDVISGKTAALKQITDEAGNGWEALPYSDTNPIETGHIGDGAFNTYGGQRGLLCEFENDPDILTGLIDDEFTVGLWVKSVAPGGIAYFFAQYDDFYMWYRNTPAVRTNFTFADGLSRMDYGGDIATGQWVYLTFSYTGSSVTLYVDGSPVMAAPASGQYGYSVDAGEDPDFAIGACLKANQITRAWNGYIDDFRIYSVGLNEAQVEALYAGYLSGPVCIEFLPGDLDRNCYVEIEDLVLFSLDWMNCTALGGDCID